MNLRLDVAYDGRPFRGFARQPELITVQGAIEDALTRLAGIAVETVGAGRTDAGVHALGQVLTAEVPETFDVERAGRALNAMLGPPIAVNQVRPAPAGFSARFSARSRTYVYALDVGVVHDPFLASTCWHRPEPLDIEAMGEAAGHLLGEHDFRSFGRVEEGASATRTIFELSCSRSGRVVRIKVRAGSFIQQMVRSLAGTLVEVGQGKRTPDSIPGVLEARDRGAAGVVAPPHGLCLVSVEYDEGWSAPSNDGDGHA